MSDTLVVKNWRRRTTGGVAEVSAVMGDFEVWFRGNTLDQMPDRGDPFLAIGLLPAMASGQALDLRELPPVSSRLLESLDQIQEIWTTWNPGLRRVRVDCRVESTPAARPGGIHFFSGGVDAVHAALDDADALGALVFINGFDFDMAESDFAVATARVERLANHLDRPLETIWTNWIKFTRHRRLSRPLTHGGCLVATGHLMAPERVTIASSNTWVRLTPWGTHPLLDPLWSSESTSIRHWGNHATRIEKLASIARHPKLLEDLWVCHVNPTTNCGTCGKCIRTRASLHLVGASDVAFVQRTPDPLAEYSRVCRSWLERMYIDEFLGFVAAQGREDEIPRLRKMRRSINRADLLRRLAMSLPIVSQIRRRRDGPIDLRPWGDAPMPGH